MYLCDVCDEPGTLLNCGARSPSSQRRCSRKSSHRECGRDHVVCEYGQHMLEQWPMTAAEKAEYARSDS